MRAILLLPLCLLAGCERGSEQPPVVEATASADTIMKTFLENQAKGEMEYGKGKVVAIECIPTNVDVLNYDRGPQIGKNYCVQVKSVVEKNDRFVSLNILEICFAEKLSGEAAKVNIGQPCRIIAKYHETRDDIELNVVTFHGIAVE